MRKLVVQGVEIGTKIVNAEEYISLTDMLKAKDGDFFVKDWLRNRNTMEYIGIWERIHNPNFKWGEFALLKEKSGLNNFKISVEEFTKQTDAISLISKKGNGGGTYAHKDIAFEFGMWISAEFKIYLVTEFQRLKEQEQKQIAWSAKRELAKINYHLHTDAIKNNIIVPELTLSQISYTYASEADLLNVALFGVTAAEWRKDNPTLDGNVRDYATIHQLLVLANMESMNAELIKQGIDMATRLEILNRMAREQLAVLLKTDNKLYLSNDNK
jgi:hypothetical protein